MTETKHYIGTDKEPRRPSGLRGSLLFRLLSLALFRQPSESGGTCRGLFRMHFVALLFLLWCRELVPV